MRIKMLVLRIGLLGIGLLATFVALHGFTQADNSDGVAAEAPTNILATVIDPRLFCG